MDLPVALPPKDSQESPESRTSISPAWRKATGFFTQRDVAQQTLELDRFISASFSSGPSYYYVLDFLNLDKPMLVSRDIEPMLGLEPENTTIESLIERVHPEDIPFITQAEKTAFSILTDQVGLARAREFKISYSGRLRVADGSYRLFNHQTIILDNDDQFGVIRTLGIHTDISHLAEQGNRKLSLLNLHGGESYRNIDVFNNPDRFLGTPSLFTRRELEVVGLLAEGKTSAVIGEIMGISAHTVKNHRKNILKKSGCKTTGQLVSKCRNEGLI